MLYDFLQLKGGKLWMDSTGASETSSMIGNVLERGSGHNPYADHFAYVCGFEVVLPNGDCIHTGFGRFANAKATPVFRWGVGPYIDGIFTQSNFGIVTRMTIWLMPVPDCFLAYYFSVAEDKDLEKIIDVLRPLRLRGIIKNALHIGNSYRVLPSFLLYPWQDANGKTPLPAEILKRLEKQFDFGAWNGTGALYGTREEVSAARKQLKKALKGKVKKLQFVSDHNLQFAERFQKPLKWLMNMDVPHMLKLVRPLHDMLKGKPTNKFIASAYWRKKKPLPKVMDPDRDACGAIWCTPMCPMDGKQARAMADIATDTLLKHGFEPGMTMTLLTERCIDNVISIIYDRDVEGEDERAMNCYRELLDKLTAQGFYPYRLGTHAMKSLSSGESEYDQFLNTMKNAIDPDGILAPGRYV
jgi:4-cresol dehydrogenase (hydroxylating)